MGIFQLPERWRIVTLKLLVHLKLLAIAATLGGVIVTGIADAEAASRQCRKLEAQLASLGGGGSSARYRKYAKALKQQKAQVRKVVRQARRIGCSPLSGPGGYNDPPRCDLLSDKFYRMQDNLRTLERGVARYGNRGSKRKRSRVLAAIEANDCRRTASRTKKKNKKKKVKNVASVAKARVKKREETINRIMNGETPVPAARSGAAGTYRTMCVRTCDGYYFPISFATTTGNFSRDEKACQSMCPGTEVALYHHDAAGEESEAMISLSGEPYTALPTAFNYRKTDIAKLPGCECRSKKNFDIVAGQRKPVDAEIPKPMAKPGADAPADSPEKPSTETAALSGEDQPETEAAPEEKPSKSIIFRAPGSDKPLKEKPKAAKVEKKKPNGDQADTDRKIRVVGPTFLPTPEVAADPQVPVPTRRP